jgi:hypothetical protein
MRKIIVGVGICIALLTAISPMASIARYDDHEITDEEGDTRFSYVDMVWGSFYEKTSEPMYLFVELKIADLKDKIGTVYAVHWYFNGVHYDVAFHNGIMLPRQMFKHFSCSYYNTRGNPIDTWNDTYNSGSFDLDTSIITWKILKNCVGDPQPGDSLTTPFGFSAQRISKLGLIPFWVLFGSFADGTSEGTTYIVEF